MPRRTGVVTATLLLLAQAPGASQTTAQAPAIFRYINIQPCGKIELGQAFAAQEHATRLTDSTYTLKSGCFGGAEQILIQVHADGRVYAMEFHYGQEEPLETFLRDYRESLGPPTGQSDLPGGGSTIYWQDSRTRFQVWSRPSGSRAGISSRLSDRSPSEP